MKKLYSNEADQIINSINGIERATPSAFFYNKLIHKIQQKNLQKEPTFIFQFKPLLVIVSLSLITIMNALMISKQSKKMPITIVNNVVTANDTYDFSEDYQLNSTTNY